MQLDSKNEKESERGNRDRGKRVGGRGETLRPSPRSVEGKPSLATTNSEHS